MRLTLEYGDGNGMEVELLRSLAWLEESRAEVTGMVRLDLPDVGVSGWARVQAVEDCPELKEGEGPLVTGWFKRRSSEVYDLVVEGEAESIGITATHPVWSVDRQAWVSAIELREGERLLAEDGSTPRMVSLSLRPGREAVYNIEVEGEQCYRVGQQGLLVHNQSGTPPSWAANQPGWSNPTANEVLYLRNPPVGAVSIKQYNDTFMNAQQVLKGQVTEVPIVTQVNAVLQFASGSTTPPTAVTNAFLRPDLWIIGYPPADRDAQQMIFFAALNTGALPSIGSPPTDTIGHIIGQQFGGTVSALMNASTGNLRSVPNIFAQSMASQQSYKNIEGFTGNGNVMTWAGALNAGLTVAISISLIYPSANGCRFADQNPANCRASMITVEWWSICTSNNTATHYGPQSVPN